MKIKTCVVITLLLATYHLVVGQNTCYSHNNAYLIGNMNIRESFSTTSQVVGTASVGDTFSVSQSRRGATWCWLDIGGGWLAKTSRVVSTPPVRAGTPTVNQPANVDNCCFVNRQCNSDQQWADGFWAYQRNECPVSHVSAPAVSSTLPPIHGSSEFADGIAAAFNFLRNNSQEWFNYSISGIQSIHPKSSFPDQEQVNVESLAFINVRSQELYVAHKFALTSDIAYLASAFVHEACHVYQWQSGKFSRWDWLFDIPDIERECYGIQATALSVISPGHRNIRLLRCEQRNHPYTFFC